MSDNTKGQVNIHWGGWDRCKGDRTDTFFAKLIIELELFSISAMIGCFLLRPRQ